jgi:hypothetical protein
VARFFIKDIKLSLRKIPYLQIYLPLLPVPPPFGGVAISILIEIMKAKDKYKKTKEN